MIEQIYHGFSKLSVGWNVTVAVNNTLAKSCFDSKACLIGSIFLENFGFLTICFLLYLKKFNQLLFIGDKI